MTDQVDQFLRAQAATAFSAS